MQVGVKVPTTCKVLADCPQAIVSACAISSVLIEQQGNPDKEFVSLHEGMCILLASEMYIVSHHRQWVIHVTHYSTIYDCAHGAEQWSQCFVIGVFLGCLCNVLKYRILADSFVNAYYRTLGAYKPLRGAHKLLQICTKHFQVLYVTFILDCFLVCYLSTIFFLAYFLNPLGQIALVLRPSYSKTQVIKAESAALNSTFCKHLQVQFRLETIQQKMAISISATVHKCSSVPPSVLEYDSL